VHPLRRIRIAFATRRLLYWTLVVALATGAGWFVASRAAALDRARDRLGTTRAVVVTSHALAAGDPLGPDDVGFVQMPLTWVPPDALSGLPDGAIASASIGPGEVVTSERIGPPGRSPLAALVTGGGPGRQRPATAGRRSGRRRQRARRRGRRRAATRRAPRARCARRRPDRGHRRRRRGRSGRRRCRRRRGRHAHSRRLRLTANRSPRPRSPPDRARRDRSRRAGTSACARVSRFPTPRPIRRRPT
jgi:hypothetical protein